MGVSMFGWRNAVPAATLAAGTSSPAGLDVAQLQNDQGSAATAWQKPGTTATLTIDTRSFASVWRILALFRTNLTAAATLRWRLGPVGMATTVYDSGTFTAGIVPGYLQSVIVLPDDVSARVAQLDIVDLGNPDGYINIPLIFAGPVWQPVVGVTWDSTIGRTDTTDEVQTRGGEEFPINRFVQRVWSLGLDAIKQNEVWAQVGELSRVAPSGQNVLFVPNMNSPTILCEAVYGRLKQTADIGYPYQGADARSWKATVTERL
jgi:hypothetical protein